MPQETLQTGGSMPEVNYNTMLERLIQLNTRLGQVETEAFAICNKLYPHRQGVGKEPVESGIVENDLLSRISALTDDMSERLNNIERDLQRLNESYNWEE